jgi:PAS domain S-box-containing protein
MPTRTEKLFNLVTRDNSLSMEIKLFRLICVTVALICLLFVLPSNLSINVSMLLNYIIIAYSGLVILLYWASCRGQHFLATFYLLTLALLDASWILNGGSLGSISFYLIAAVIYPVVFFTGVVRMAMFTLLVTDYCLLLYLEYRFPSLIIPFATSRERFIDISMGFFTSVLASALFFWVVLNNFINALKEQQKAEETLRRNEASEKARADELAAIMDTAPAIILISRDAQGQSITGNRTATDRLRIPTTGNFSKIAPPGERPEHYLILHDDRETPFDELPIQRAIRGETITDYTQEIVFNDGSHMTLFGNAIPLLDDLGKPRGAVAAFVDVTEHKLVEESLRKSEEQYRMLAESMSEGIVVLDSSNLITYSNPACSRMLRCPTAELIGRSILEFLPESSHATIQDQLAGLLTGKEVSFPLNFVNQEGEIVNTLVSGHPVLSPDGAIVGSFGVFADISKHRRLEAQLQHSQKLESVGRLAGGIAHDINNKLTVITGYAQMVLFGELEKEKIVEYIREINHAAELSREIISQLLTFSRQQVIAPLSVNINKLITNSKNSLTRLIGEDIAFKLETSPGIWSIYIDPVQMDQVIMNMAVNARDAMPDGGTFAISTANISIPETYCDQNLEARPGDFIQITFRDNGTGMDEETIKHIFEPFFTTKEVGKGSGLGLATTYGIVSQNGGFIEVASEPGMGTTFGIYLPRHYEAPLVKKPREKAIIAGCGSILLVEDEESVRKMTQALLLSAGYVVHVASSPLEALQIASRRELAIDVVLTDVVMPVMNCKEMVDRMRVLRPGLKSIFISGYTSEHIARKGLVEAGINLIQKPFDIEVLNQALTLVINGESSGRNSAEAGQDPQTCNHL